MRERVLFVDDDVRVLQAFKRRLFKTYDLQIAESAEKAIEILKNGASFSVIVSDQQMPGMKGIEFLSEVRELAPLSARIMLTGNADRQTAVDSVNNAQIFRYLTKPCSPEDVSEAIEDGIAHHKMLAAERDLLEQTLAGSAKLLVDILAANDPSSFQEVTTLRQMGKQFALFIRHPKAWELDMTIMLSSIGDVMLPPDVRTKLDTGEELGRLEAQMVADTPRVARDLLLNIPRLRPIAESIYYKNKNFDGSGYPMDTVKGEQIPINARILRLLTLLFEHADGHPPDAHHFDSFTAQDGVVDGKLLQLAQKCFASEGKQLAVERQELSVVLDEVQSGDRLLEDLVTESGKLALGANRILTDALIHKMRQFHSLRPLKLPVRICRESEEKAGESNEAA